MKEASSKFAILIHANRYVVSENVISPLSEPCYCKDVSNLHENKACIREMRTGSNLSHTVYLHMLFIQTRIGVLKGQL